MLEYIMVTFGIPLVYIALLIAALCIIAFSVFQMVQDLKKARVALASIGILVVVFFLCYLLTADINAYTNFVKDGASFVTIKAIDLPFRQIQMVEASIFLFYILLLGSFLAIVYASVSRYFK